jgi:uncharacterized protein YdhG (YjbR/CyaY superfamily)
MSSASPTPKDYYDQLPDDRREHLLDLRDLIKRTWPKIKEDMAYGMPTFHLDGHMFCAIANQKHYMALYIMPYDLLSAFKMELKAYNCGRSCIRFRKLDEEKAFFFERVLKYTGNRFADSALYGRATGTSRTAVRA